MFQPSISSIQHYLNKKEPDKRQLSKGPRNSNND